MSQPMNREQRRMLKKQGQEVNDAGQIVETKPRKTKTAGGGSGSGSRVTEKGAGGDDNSRRRREPVAQEERTSPGQFIREVRSELKKVAWPTRTEVINYSLVVFFTVVALTVFIGLLDWGFSLSILELFKA